MTAWRTAKRLLTLRDELDALYRDRNRASDGTIGDLAHQNVQSEHNPDENGVVRAMDITIPVGPVGGQELANWIIRNRDDSLWYVIVDGRIWEDGRWTKYNGADQHYGHIHVSLYDKPELYDITTPWLLKGEETMTPDALNLLAQVAWNTPVNGDDKFVKDYTGKPIEDTLKDVLRSKANVDLRTKANNFDNVQRALNTAYDKLGATDIDAAKKALQDALDKLNKVGA